MKHKIFIISLFAVYIVVMTAIMIWLGIGIAPDRYALVLLLGALVIKKARKFFIDWVPFLFILISYDFLRGLAGALVPRANFTFPILADQAIFGVVPAVSLQAAFFNPLNLQWYDYFLTVFYFLHFALPLGFAYILWIYGRQYFKEFVTGISLLSYGAWATYVLFPAAPPWLANKEGLLPGITKVMDLTFQAFPEKFSIPTVYTALGPNIVAAVPSMHAAYPVLVLLFALHYFGKRALFFLPYVFTVWFSIIYLGEHYVFDILTGVLYAVVFFVITIKIIHRKKATHTVSAPIVGK